MSNWIEPSHGFETKNFVRCPSCNEGRHFYGHLLKDFRNGLTFGPWACDECGVFSEFRCDGLGVEDLRIRISTTRAPLVKKYVLLERDEIKLVIKASLPSDWAEANEEYLYNSHTCPTNYLTSTVAILLGVGKNADSDPHGVFQYVTSAPVPANDDPANATCPDWMELFGIKE